MSIATTQKNFHVPLPEETYRELREEAVRVKQPATALARMAIEIWLEERRAAALHAEIAVFAKRHAGTELDLDPALEAAGIEFMLSEIAKENEPKKRKAKAK